MTRHAPFDPSDEPDAAFFAAIRLSKLITRARARQTAGHPHVDGAAFPLLFAASCGPRRITELAEDVHSDASTVSRQVAGLVTHGLVERRPDPVDRRAQVIEVTSQGHEVIAALRAKRSRLANHLMADWPPEDVATLRTLLERLGTAFENHLSTPRNEIP